MAFDLDRFQKAKFEPRRQEVEVELLKDFFPEGQPPIWIVRGLSGVDLYRTADAANSQQTMIAAAKAMTSNAEKIAAFREAFGLNAEATPADMARRIQSLVLGSVEPKIDLPDAAKLAEHFATEFVKLTKAIDELTGMGADLVKPDAVSQKTPA